jgi:hypothetical protein
LDIKKNPARPCYKMAKDLPLCFFDAEYADAFNWNFDVDVLRDVYTTLQGLWIELNTK